MCRIRSKFSDESLVGSTTLSSSEGSTLGSVFSVSIAESVATTLADEGEEVLDFWGKTLDLNDAVMLLREKRGDLGVEKFRVRFRVFEEGRRRSEGEAAAAAAIAIIPRMWRVFFRRISL